MEAGVTLVALRLDPKASAASSVNRWNKVAFLKPMSMTALIIAQNGVLNVASLDTTKGWQGLDTLGNATLVPGSPVAVFTAEADRLRSIDG